MVFSGGSQLATPIGYQTLYRTAAVKYTYPDGRKFRATWVPLSAAAGYFSDLTNFPSGTFDPPITLNEPPAFTGSWYNSERSGEGYHIEILVDGRAVLQWYGFGVDGEKRWFVDMDGLVTETEDGINISFSQVYSAFGTVFGENFNPNDVTIEPWGSAEFNLTCFAGSMTYQSNDPAYGSGGYDIQPLTRPAGNVFRCN